MASEIKEKKPRPLTPKVKDVKIENNFAMVKIQTENGFNTMCFEVSKNETEKDIIERALGMINIKSGIDEFNQYSGKLFKLLDFIPHSSDDLYEELDDTLDSMISKKKNKKRTEKLLLPLVPDDKKKEFLQELEKI